MSRKEIEVTEFGDVKRQFYDVDTGELRNEEFPIDPETGLPMIPQHRLGRGFWGHFGLDREEVIAAMSSSSKRCP